MSDSSQGEGWWVASDGKWYPPDTVPEPPAVPDSGSEEAGTLSDVGTAASESETSATDVGEVADGLNFKVLLAVVLVVAAVVAVVLLVGGSDDKYANVHGSVTLNSERGLGNLDGDGFESCSPSDLGGYSDIPSMQFIVRDLNGTALIAMEPSLVNGFNSELSSFFCVYIYYGENLPKQDSYIIDAGRRGEIVVSASDFEYDAEDDDYKIFSLDIGS